MQLAADDPELGIINHISGADVKQRAKRFWITHAPENLPSGAGMQKAGFRAVGQLSFQRDYSLGLIPLGLPERARIGAALLGVELIEDGLSPVLALC